MRALALCVLILFAAPAGAADCYESTIISPSPFMGNNDEVFRLQDGSYWIVRFEYSYLYEYYPNVIICPASGKLHIKDKALNVEPLR